MLVAESKTGAWLALTTCFDTLAAGRFLLVTLELPLTASQAMSALVEGTSTQVDKLRRTNQSETSCLCEDYYKGRLW